MTGDGRALSEEDLAAEVQRHLRRLVLVLEMLTEVEAERDQALAEASGKEAVLLRLKGIGPESAAVPCAEESSTERSPAGMAAYAGLVPRTRSTAAAPASSKELARRATRGSGG